MLLVLGSVMLKVRAHFYMALCLLLAAATSGFAQNQIVGNPPAIQTASADNLIKFVGRFSGHTEAVNCVAFSPDGKTAFSGGDDDTIRLWDLHSFKQIRTFTEPFGAVHGICVSPNGNLLICAGYDHRMRIWNLTTGTQISVFDCGCEAQTVAISPNGSWLAVGTFNGGVLWNLNTGREVAAFSHSDMGDYAFAWSPDGNYLALGGYEAQVRIWSISQQRFILTFHPTGAQIHALVFTPDGRYLICGTDQGDLVQCDATTGQQVRVFNSLDKLMYVTGVAVTPDGRELFSSEKDKTVRIWSLDTGQQIGVLREHNMDVLCVAVSSDGKYVLSGSADATAGLWQLPKSSTPVK